MSRSEGIDGGAAQAALSLLFGAGERPDASTVWQMAEAQPGLSISHDPSARDAAVSDGPAAGWLELLASGLTFHLCGLSPASPASLPERRHSFGLDPALPGEDWEAIGLVPGPHLSGGERMMPVIRTLASVGAQLSALPGLRAIAWHAARSWSSPTHFAESVTRWTRGGALPGLGLTALAPCAGALESEGLALFTGQELRIAPELAADRVEGAKLGLRLLHLLVEHGPIRDPEHVTGPDGTRLLLEPSDDGRVVTASSRRRRGTG